MKSTDAHTTRVDPPTLLAALRSCVLGASSIARELLASLPTSYEYLEHFHMRSRASAA